MRWREILSSRANFPSWASRRMAAAVNCLVIEPISKTVSGVAGVCHSRLAIP